MSKVTIGLIQLETRLGDKEYNLALAQEKVREAAAQGAKIICLPELFVTGYNLGVFGDKLYDMAEGLSGPTITALRAQAKELGVYIIAPIALQVYTTRPLNNAAVRLTTRAKCRACTRKTTCLAASAIISRARANTPCLKPSMAALAL